jgi:transcriptional regulator with XRE-family HTH domain
MAARGWTQTQLGQALGCSQSAVSKLLRGLVVAEDTRSMAAAWLNGRGSSESTCEGLTLSPLQPAETEATAGESSKEDPMEHLNSDTVVPIRPNGVAATNGAAGPKAAAAVDSAASTNGGSEPAAIQTPATPYEAILRRLLEEVAQEKLEAVAGEAAKGIRVRVTLEWAQ